MAVFRSGGGVVVMLVVMVGVIVVGSNAATTTTTPPPPPLPPLPPSTTAGVMTEAPPPKPSELRMRPKDCPLYVLGELRAIKKHGETWFNDGNACELCKCDEGLKRCYYHYCNLRTEVVTNPPAGRPPLDDEDGGEGEDEEGSGRPPPTPLKNHPGELRVLAEENDTRLPVFCGTLCYKRCPWGYKMDPVKQCRQCSCRRRCHGLEKCHLRCPDGLATDSHGCHVCQCRDKGHKGLRSDPTCNDTSVRGCLDGTHTRQVGESWSRGACVSCRCVAAGYTECNVTHCSTPPPPCPPRQHSATPWGTTPIQDACCPLCQETSAEEGAPEVTVGRAEVTVQSAWERRLTYAQPRTPTPPHEAASDGAVKSAVQAVGIGWWQMVLIMVPLAVVCVVAAVCALKHWRRTHRDKYDINAYRMPGPLTEKVRPVATAADHVRGRMM